MGIVESCTRPREDDGDNIEQPQSKKRKLNDGTPQTSNNNNQSDQNNVIIPSEDTKTDPNPSNSEKKDTDTSPRDENLLPFSTEEWRSFELIKTIEINYNTKIFDFKFPSQYSNVNLHLPVSSCILTKYFDTNDNKDIIRPYTPITEANPGELRLAIKKYENGKMSSYIHNLKIGDKIDIKGPFKKKQYQFNEIKFIGMIAGGTGITPMLQVLDYALPNSDDNTEFILLFGNVSEKDILFKDEIDQLQKKYPQKFRVNYIIDKSVEPNWKGFTGYVTKEIIEKTMPPKTSDCLIYVCGPPPMMKALSGTKTEKKEQGELTGHLKDMGYKKEQVFKF